MKIVLNRKTLGTIMRLAKFADKPQAQPILTHILIEAMDRTRVRFSATDTESSIRIDVHGEVIEAGTAVVPIRMLHDIVKVLESDVDVTLTATPNAVEVTAGRSRFRLMALEAVDFPQMPTADMAAGVPVDVAAFLRAIRMTAFSVYAGSDRPNLSGILTILDGQTLRMVSTDSHRMSQADLPMPVSLESEVRLMLSERVLAGVKAFAELAMPSFELLVHKGIVHLSYHGMAGEAIAGVQLSLNAMDLDFPPYEQIIPKRLAYTWTVDRVDALEALKRIAAVTADRSLGVRMQVGEGLLRIAMENPAVGTGEETVDVTAGQDVGVRCFNARYWMDVLAAVDGDQVVVEMGDELDPTVVRSGDGAYLGVIMPMRI